MKYLLRCLATFLFYSGLSAQNYINDVVIDRKLIEETAYSSIGQAKQTKAMIRTLDSLNVVMVIEKSRLPESSQPYSTDTLYISNGEIAELRRHMDGYKAKYDAEGRLSEKYRYSEPNGQVSGMHIFRYDSLNFPVYSLYVSTGVSWGQNDNYQLNTGNYKERFAQPFYNTHGVLDSVRFFGNDDAGNYLETYDQDTYKNGDSIVITRRLLVVKSGYERTDFFVRTVHYDTVQIRLYEGRINGFHEHTFRYLNGLLVESYMNSGQYNYTTRYNRLGLPVESFGKGVTNDGCGNALTVYEYYTVNPRKKNNYRLVKVE